MIKRALSKTESKIVQMLAAEQRQLEAALAENRQALAEYLASVKERLQLPSGRIALENDATDPRIVVLCVEPEPEAAALDGDR